MPWCPISSFNRLTDCRKSASSVRNHTRRIHSGSSWAGEGFQTRVVDEILQIKAESAMLGYLNAPSPFTNDGWFNTGDKVEVDGDYFRILGRRCEIINVGGQKVYPAQVESVMQEMPEAAEVSVYGEQNALMGQIVCAAIRLRESCAARQFHRELRQFCRQRLQEFQIAVRRLLPHGNADLVDYSPVDALEVEVWETSGSDGVCVICGCPHQQKSEPESRDRRATMLTPGCHLTTLPYYRDVLPTSSC
jgi:acyl-CoA synthetase (AMP-forming)/AMP-acid ligase II